MNRRKFLISTSILAGSAALGALYWDRRWRYIVVHHSGGSFGNLDFLRQVHRKRQPRDPVDAIPYHYIIGNGHGLGLGEIATGLRQRYGIWGTHVSAHNMDRNFRGIGICLIGNFEEHAPHAKQIESLAALTKSLVSKHRIPLGNIAGHGMIEGESTKCPGQYFPMDRFKQAIA